LDSVVEVGSGEGVMIAEAVFTTCCSAVIEGEGTEGEGTDGEGTDGEGTDGESAHAIKDSTRTPSINLKTNR